MTLSKQRPLGLHDAAAMSSAELAAFLEQPAGDLE